MKYFLAIDIGASSGRHIVGYLENEKTVLDEVYRFPNGVKTIDNHLVWDLEDLYNNVLEGIKKALLKYKNIESMAIDTWGVDYVLMDGEKEIMPCYSYRDGRTKEAIELVHNIIPFNDLYKITGSQFQEFNTIYQLYYDKINGRLDKATAFLHIPEYLTYKLTGKMMHEYTNASTTGLMDGKTFNYSNEIINKLGFKKSLFSDLYKPGTMVGEFTNDVKNKVGGSIDVVLCATHDTASAVIGIPMDENAPYISSGTWSLFGVKTEEVVVSDEARRANFSNEYGPNYIRLQKNIMGLWIIQKLSKELNLSFIEMVDIARKSDYQEIFNVNDECFLSTPSMKDEIKRWLKNHNKPLPLSDLALINATYHSLAYSYKEALLELEKITSTKYDKIYIVGGGAKNDYLNELTKVYTKCNVIALPIEATAIGNLKIQMERKI